MSTRLEGQSGVPSAEPVRFAPMTVADMLDNAVTLFKAHWRSLSFVTLLLSIPVGLVTMGASFIIGSQLAPDTDITSLTGLLGMTNLVGGAIFAFLAGELVSIFVTSLAVGFVTRLIAGALLGQQLTTRQAFRSIIRLWPALIVVTFLVDVALALAAAAGFLLLFVGALVTVPFVAVIFFAAIPAVVVEETGPITALKRSVQLCIKGFFVYAVAIFFAFVVDSVFTLAISQLGLLFTASPGDSLYFLVTALQSILDVIASAVNTVIMAVVALMIYLDARIRFEGFDIRLQMARLPRLNNNRTLPAE